jgi:hypothetical protein
MASMISFRRQEESRVRLDHDHDEIPRTLGMTPVGIVGLLYRDMVDLERCQGSYDRHE